MYHVYIAALVILQAAKRPRLETAEGEEESAGSDAESDDNASDSEAQQSLGERLAAMSAQLDAEAAAAKARDWQEQQRLASKPVRADTLSVSLAQALKSSDESLLEHCLDTTDAEIINATIDRYGLKPQKQIIKLAHHLLPVA